jgi:hypothetical protein
MRLSKVLVVLLVSLSAIGILATSASASTRAASVTPATCHLAPTGGIVCCFGTLCIPQ